MSPSPVLALYIPPPPFSPSSIPRSVSPLPRPPSRTERLLRDTLEKDARQSARSTSPLLTFDDHHHHHHQWQLKPSSSSSSRSRSGSATSFVSTRPHVHRVHTAPNSLPTTAHLPHSYSHSKIPPLPSSPSPKRPSSRITSSQASMAIPVARHPPQSPGSPNALGLCKYGTPPDSYTIIPPSSISGNTTTAKVERKTSVARKRLERTLTRDNGARVVSATRQPGYKIQNSKSCQDEEFYPAVIATAESGSPHLKGQGLSPESRTNSLESTSSELLTPSPSLSPLPYHHNITPPPSPPFNPVIASRHCASIEGVIHFSDIEGLGEPPEERLTDEDEVARRKEKDKGWWVWWNK